MSNKIQQEVVLKANAKKVYAALTESKQFSLMSGGAPTEIGSEEGSSFSCFGGMITGRSVELVPGKLIVQAWRTKNWEPGVYSIVKFELKSQGENTLLQLEHTGFPEGEESHLDPGWQANYFEPLKKYLA
jgi:activator of HSP90 ATPase